MARTKAIATKRAAPGQGKTQPAKRAAVVPATTAASAAPVPAPVSTPAPAPAPVPAPKPVTFHSKLGDVFKTVYDDPANTIVNGYFAAIFDDPFDLGDMVCEEVDELLAEKRERSREFKNKNKDASEKEEGEEDDDDEDDEDDDEDEDDEDGFEIANTVAPQLCLTARDLEPLLECARAVRETKDIVARMLANRIMEAKLGLPEWRSGEKTAYLKAFYRAAAARPIGVYAGLLRGSGSSAQAASGESVSQ